MSSTTAIFTPANHSSLLKTTPLVNNRFRLEKLIGSGGHGAVWKAIDLQSGKECALKFVRSYAYLIFS